MPDTVGFTTPEEFARIFDHLTENIKSDIKLSLVFTVTMTWYGNCKYFDSN
ncbi:MAG: hypothetical protein ACLTZB_01580 [Streptococcus salivarius]